MSSAAGSKAPTRGSSGAPRWSSPTAADSLLSGLPHEQQCWMSHRDSVFEPPTGFVALASSPGSPVAACESPERGLYGIQFHPEVVHTPYGTQILDRFLRQVAGLEQRWSPASVIDEQVAAVRAQVGDGGVICGLSGGVDSATAAALVHRAVGDQLTCVLVDHGLLRKNEAEQVVEAFRDRGIRLIHVAAQERFLKRLAGVVEPEGKRKIIGEEFIRVFEEQAEKLPGVRFLVQGTLYSDVIESGGDGRAGADDDQVAPQRRRPSRGPRPGARRAASDAVQGRGPRGRHRARSAGANRLAPALPRAGPRDSRGRRRGDGRAARDPPRGRRDPPGGDPRCRALPGAVAVVLRPAGGALGRRAGRRPHLCLSDRRSGR